MTLFKVGPVSCKNAWGEDLIAINLTKGKDNLLKILIIKGSSSCTQVN